MKDICPKSRGTCEICGKQAVCYDMASSKLPTKSEVDQIREAAMSKRDVHLKLPDRSKNDEKVDKG
jgi:hypothetical protein